MFIEILDRMEILDNQEIKTNNLDNKTNRTQKSRFEGHLNMCAIMKLNFFLCKYRNPNINMQK